jgi:tetratricopeptide (TPR) repeat protein/predicted Ser/Thr protein kinase
MDAAERDVAAAVTREAARGKLFGAHKQGRVEVDRYVVERRLGAGAMGQVFLAHDPELDRKVALKLVTPGVDASPQANARLLREARALAKLDHPNAVPVHDAGTSDGRVWIAMEFIDGVTLGQWLAAAERSLASIVEVFAAAGRGLAAAHAAGLLHRDFKPDNVMIGEHVRVTDFGLAASFGEEPTHDGERSGEPLEQARTLTRNGAVQGTIGYIAPELLAGARPHAGSDQFAFCVSLFEAIFGARPFVGLTTMEVLLATQEGRIVEPPTKRNVPRWLRALVLRGISHAPEQRFPSMDALVHELRRDRSRRPKMVGALGISMVGVVGIAIASQPEPCPSDPSHLEGVWDPARRDATQAAFEATRAPYAEDAFARVSAELDAWVEAWTAARTDACEATRVRGEQSERLLDLRIACLDAELVEVRALTDALVLGTDETVRRAAQAVAMLPSVARCDDAKALESSVGAIDDPDQAAAASLAQQGLAEQRALAVVGRFAEALEAAERADEAARQSEHGPTIAEVLDAAGALAMQRGEVEMAEQKLTRAVWEAEASGHDRMAAIATAQLVGVVGYRQARPERGLEWADHSAALLRRIGGDPKIEAERHHGVGLVYEGQGRYADARAEYEQALALRRELFGDHHLIIADTLGLIASTQISAGDLSSAEKHFAEALAIVERNLGKHHPDYASALANVGIAAHENGRVDEALEKYAEAMRIFEATVGPDYFDALLTRNNIVRGELERGNVDAALDQARASVRDAERVFGPQHPDTLRARGTLVQVLEQKGETVEARAILEQTIAPGGNDAVLDDMRMHLAFRLMEAKAPERALELLAAARAGKEARDATDPTIVDVHEATVLALLLIGRDAAEASSRSLALARERGRLEEIVRTRIADAKQLPGEGARTLAELTLQSLGADEDALASEVRTSLASAR